MESENQPTGLTDAQKRLLTFMDARGSQWFTLVELDQTRLLEPDDVVTIPSLVERQLLMHMPALKTVALTASGTILADEIRSEEAPCQESFGV